MGRSRSSAIAWRRACRSPRLPSVTSFSTTGRRSFALGSVVTICSCLINAAAMFANMARRCSGLRLSLRWALPWRIQISEIRRQRTEENSSVVCHLSSVLCSVMILEALGQLVDIVGRPARHFHAEMQTHLGQHLLDLVERLAPEIGRAQHLGFALLYEIADINDVVVLEAIGRAYGELELVDFLEERRVEGKVGDGFGHHFLP